jgi:hypothetical protein
VDIFNARLKNLSPEALPQYSLEIRPGLGTKFEVMNGLLVDIDKEVGRGPALILRYPSLSSGRFPLNRTGKKKNHKITLF